MEVLLIIFAILYLKGMDVGLALAIVSIVYGFLKIIFELLKTIVDRGSKNGTD